MNPYDHPAAPPPLDIAPPRRRSWRGLRVALVALGLAAMLVLGVFVGATMLSTAQAAAGGPDNANASLFAQASTPGARAAGMDFAFFLRARETVQGGRI